MRPDINAIEERRKRLYKSDADNVYAEDYLADTEFLLNRIDDLTTQLAELLATYENLGTIDTLTRLQRDYSDLRNELCLACGKYKEAHKGRCNGCRWGEKGEGE